MRRQLLTLALAGILGALFAADATACHMKLHLGCKKPAPVCEPCPPPPPPVCEPVPTCAPAPKCGLFKHLGGCGHKKMFSGLCHKKPACEPAPCAGPVAYEAAPVYAAPQAYASGQ